MNLLDGSPELSLLVLDLAREHDREAFTAEALIQAIWRVARPSPGGLDRARFDRLFVEALTRCGYVQSPSATGPFSLTDRSLAYAHEYERADREALNALSREVGIGAPHAETPRSSSAAATSGSPDLFTVTPDLVRGVLAEAGVPAELLASILDSYRQGRVYLSDDGGAYRFVLRGGLPQSPAA